MTVIFASGPEDHDFLKVGAPTVDGSYFRAGYARGSLKAFTTNYWKFNPSVSPLTDFWAQARCQVLNSNFDHSIMQFGSALLTPVQVRNELTALVIETWNGSAWVTQVSSATGAITSNILHLFTVRIESFGANGTITVYVDGVQQVQWTGSLVQSSGLAGISEIRLRGSASSTNAYYSEVLVTSADTDPRLLSVASRWPTGDGTGTTGYGSIDEVTASTADFISYPNVGDRKQFKWSALPATSDVQKVVTMSAQGVRTAGGPQHFRFYGIVNGVEVQSPDLQFDTAWSTVTYQFPYNATWTLAALGNAATEFGMEATA
jgi:hypothetical protein